MQTGEVLRRVVFDLLDAAKGGRLKKLKEVNKREIVEGVTEEYMDRRIHVLLDYVKEHSPYYKDHPEWTELKDFPVMTKGDFIENYDQVLVDNSEEQGKLYRLSTSGSTGTPFTVLCDGDKMSRVNMEKIYEIAKIILYLLYGTERFPYGNEARRVPCVDKGKKYDQ